MPEINWIGLGFAQCPQRQKAGDVGVDLFSKCTHTIKAGEVGYKLDFGVFLSDDSSLYVSAMMLHIRSSMAASGLRLANGVGVIEPSFSGFILNKRIYGITAMLDNVTGEDIFIDRYVRVCQLVIYGHGGNIIKPTNSIKRVEDREWLELYDGRRGGFGSTGK